MKFDWTHGELAEGLRRYDAGEFFAAHEAWGSVRLRSREPAKTFLQGLIQVAAFHHLQHHNSLGTALLLQAALRRLEWFRLSQFAHSLFPADCGSRQSSRCLVLVYVPASANLTGVP